MRGPWQAHDGLRHREMYYDQTISYIIQHINWKFLNSWIWLLYHYASQLKGMLELVVNCILEGKGSDYGQRNQNQSENLYAGLRIVIDSANGWKFNYMLWQSTHWGCAGICCQLHPLEVKDLKEKALYIAKLAPSRPKSTDCKQGLTDQPTD